MKDSIVLPPETSALLGVRSQHHQQEEEQKRMDDIVIEMLQQRCRDGEVPISLSMSSCC
jgi:hypothetical protein